MNKRADNRGALFVNQRKTHDRQPDYRGDVSTTCAGCGMTTRHELAGWRRQTRTGGEMISLAASELRERSETTDQPQPDPDDEIPF